MANGFLYNYLASYIFINIYVCFSLRVVLSTCALSLSLSLPFFVF